jgi:predicted nucleotidyltransferase component of viral defense system
MGGSAVTFSSSEILPVTEAIGFKAEMVEKVLHLLNLLNALNSHPFLKGKWVLKGGTALNMFLLDLPRLSVDIDLNYIGALDREKNAGGKVQDRTSDTSGVFKRRVQHQESPGRTHRREMAVELPELYGTIRQPRSRHELYVQAAALGHSVR